MKAVVISARGWHLDYLGCYGSDWVETPALDRLAAAGVVFDQHYAERPDAAGARRAWRSGRFELPRPEGGGTPAGPGVDLLALLRSQGVVTALVSDAPAGDFAVGWDRLHQPGDGKDRAALVDTLEAASRVLESLEAQEHWLLWVDLAVLLPPWDVPPVFLARYFGAGEPADEADGENESEEGADEEETPLEPWAGEPPATLDPDDDETLDRLQLTYAAAVTYLDAGLEALLGGLEERGLAGEVLVAVTSDRGLPLGEHGAVGDGLAWPHDELIHIPLLMRRPAGGEPGRRVPALTQAVDLLPTLLAAFGVPVPPEVHGQDLWPLARGDVEQLRPYACAGHRVGAAVCWALRTPEWGFLLPLTPAAGDRPRLYVKPEDRWEVNDVVQHHLDRADNLERVLRAFGAAARQPGPLQAPELQEKAPTA